MPLGWLVLGGLTSLAAIAAIGVAIRAAPSGRAELGMLAALTFFALIVTPVYVLGYTGQLYAPLLAVVSAALSAGAFLASARGRGVVPHLYDVRRRVALLVGMPLSALREAARARSVVVLGLLACAYVIGGTVVLSYLAPSMGWDALFYHEPMIGFAIQNHGFAIVDLPANPMLQQVNGYPRACQSVALWFVIFTDRTFIEIGNTLAAPWLMVAVFALASRYGDRVTSLGWAVVALLMPGMWAQLRHAYIDVEVTFFLFAALYFATRPTFRVRDAVCATLAMALLVASKGTGLTLAPPIALVAYGRLLFHFGKQRRGVALAVIAGGTLALAGIASLSIVRNIVVFHNPVWPVTLDVDAFNLHFKGLIKYRDMNPAPPLRELIAMKYDLPKPGFDDIIVRDYGYAIPWVILPVGFVATVVVVLATLRDLVIERRLGETWGLFVLVVLGLLAAKTSNSWAVSRFNMQPIVTFMIAIGWVCGRGRWVRLGEGIVASAIVLSIIPFFWIGDWLGGVTSVQARELWHASREERTWMNPDPTSMTRSTARLREKELGPGDRTCFTQEQSWMAMIWNFRFSNRLEYVRYDDVPRFLARVQGCKWVVVGASTGARSALDSRAQDWEYIGEATPHDATVAFRKR